MESTRKREWALIAAFMFCQLSLISMYAFINMEMNYNPEKVRQMGLFNMLGVCSGVMLLPLILPLRELRNGRAPSRYYLRLALVAILFLPNVILRVLGPEFWYMDSPVSVAISFCNGVAMVFVFGLFVSLTSKNRIFWFALSVSLRQLVLFFIPALNRYFLPDFISRLLFYATAALILIFGVLLFIFLFSVSSDEESLPAGRNLPALPVSDSPGKIHWPVYLLPVLAALVFFWANSFINKIFMPAQNLYDLDFYLLIALLLLLPVVGFLAGISWPRYLKFAVYFCALFFLLSPPLLFSSGSQILFLAIYTFNKIAMYMVVITFPFIISDLYWNNPRSRGYLAYLLAITIYLIRMNIWIVEGLFEKFPLDNAYSVLLLSLTAILFYVLSRIFFKTLEGTTAAAPAAPELKIPHEYRAENFKKHKLTNREVQTAELILQGLSNDEIKEKMSISLATVKTYVSEILRKYNVKQRTEFMAKFFRP